jgi:hypothetical protein
VKKRVLKITIGVVLALAALAAGAYLYISSGHFIKTHVLPRIAESIGCDVQAAEVDFSALSRIELRELRIGSETDPLMQAGTIRVRYRALSFLSGQIIVDEVLLDHVRIAATPEKLEALSKSEPPSEKKPGKASEPKKMPELMLKDIRVNDLALSYTQAGTDPVELQLSNLSLDLPELASGSDFQLSVAAQAKAGAGEQMTAEVRELSLDVVGTLGLNTMPSMLTLKMDVKGLAGKAGPVSLDGRSVQITAEVTGDPANYALQEFSVAEYVGEVEDAALTANGSLGISPASADLDLMLDIAPDSLLNVIGSVLGDLDFGQTAVSYTGHVEYTSGRRLATRGGLQIDNLTVAAPGMPALRPMQVSMQHDLAVDLAEKAITLSRLDAKVSDRNRDVVTVKLDRPVIMDLQNPDLDAAAAISVRVDRLDLTLLNAFLVDRPEVRILRGELNRNVTVSIENGGRQIGLNIGPGGIDKLLLQHGERRVGPLRINHEAALQLTDFNTLNIDHFEIAAVPLAAGPIPAATVAVNGVLHLGEEPGGRMNARINGRGSKLAVLARPFLEDHTAEALHPVLLENAAFTLDSQLYAELSNGVVQLNESYFRVHGFGQDQLVDVMLEKTSFALDDMRRNPEKLKMPLRFSVNDLPLDRLVLFLPTEAEIAKLAGKLNVDGRAVLTGPAKGASLEAAANVENALFVLKDGTALSAPVTSSLDFSLDYEAGGIARIERMTAVFRQAGRREPLLDLEIAGHFDTGMDPAVRNVLQISTRSPVLLDALENLVVTSGKREQPIPQSVPETATQTAPPPDLWMAVSIAADEAIHGDLRIRNLGIEAEYQGGLLQLSKADALVNEGAFAAFGMCDFSTPESPQYDFKFNGQNLLFAPVLATFIPRMDLHTRGGVKEIEIMMKGAGFDLASMQENLEAQVNMQVDQLKIERMSGTFGRLTEALLLGVFHLTWNDLSFTNGELDMAIDRSRFGDQDIHIQRLLLQAPVFQLDGRGTVQFGGAWAPDMEIKTGFVEDKANSLRRRGYAVSAQADGAGYYPGPSIPLKGDLTRLSTQAGLVTELLVRSGKLSRQDAMKADLMNRVIGSLGGAETNGDKKTDISGLVGGILGGMLETQSPQESQEERNDDPGEAIGNLIQGLFGN